VIPEHERSDEIYTNLRRTYDDYNYIVETKPNLWLINLRVSKEIWKGSELSFFVNNLFNYRPLYQRQRVPSGSLSYTRRNPELYYGVEFSIVVDEFFNYINRF
jgi:outer membrane receptor protein involved in Fe transport